MSQTPSEDCYEDVTKLESKVVLALSRLQNSNKCSSRHGRFQGVDSKQVVDYLSSHYCYLDGDIESQVITALLSCVKSGIICALENGKYQLLGPGSKTTVSNCLTRASHGPRCHCLKLLDTLPTTTSNTCCFLRLSVGSPKKRVIRTTAKGKKKKQSIGTRKRSMRKGKDVQKKTRAKCVQKAVGKKEAPKDNPGTKCDYCLEIHPTPSQQKGKALCMQCHPSGSRFGVPFDKFSPREEVM